MAFTDTSQVAQRTFYIAVEFMFQAHKKCTGKKQCHVIITDERISLGFEGLCCDNFARSESWRHYHDHVLVD